MVNESLPGVLRGRFKVSKFTLGGTAPLLGPITFHPLAGGARVKVGVGFDSSVDISLDLGARAGVRSVKFSGCLVLRLGPFINEVPVVGGVAAYFLDRPRLELDFTGLGNIADAPGLASIVRRTIDSIIAGVAVLPNVISVPLGTEEQGVDHALLKQPAPMGVMRVTAVQATDLLGKDVRLLGSPTSDPYVRAMLSGDEWRSSTVKATCNPKWREDDHHDFLVYDTDQHFSFEVYDADRFSSDDLLGVTRSVAVSEACGAQEMLLPLAPGPEQHKAGDVEGSSHCGVLKLRFSWFELLPEMVVLDGFVVAVKVKCVMLPVSLATKVSILVELGDVKRSTPLLKVGQSSSAKTVDRTTCHIVKRCYENGVDRATIAKIVDLSASSVDDLLGTDEHARSAEADLEEPHHVRVDRVIYIPQVQAFFDAGKFLALSVVDAKGKVLGTAAIKVDTAARGGPAFELSDVPLRLPDGGASGIEVRMAVAPRGLQQRMAQLQEFDIGSTEKAFSEGGSPWR